MTPDLDDRVLRLACRAVDMYGLLEHRGGAAREVARQYLRAATSVGANCAEAAAGQIKADFYRKDLDCPQGVSGGDLLVTPD